MTVTEATQADGSWDLKLRPGTPGAITDLLQNFYSQVKVFSAHVAAEMVSTLNPFYTGVLLRNPSLYECGGAGPNWYLGEPNTSGDQVGPIFETAETHTSGTLTTWAHAVADQCGLGYGTIGATATTFSGSFQYVAPRVVLDPYMTSVFGVEYRVGPSLNLSIGATSELYKTPTGGNITTVISNDDPTDTVGPYRGVQASALNLEFSVEDLLRRVVLKGATTTAGISVPGWTYQNPAGGTLNRIRYTVNANVASGDMNGAINRVLNLDKNVKKVGTVSVSDSAPFPFIVGDYCYVFDVDRSFYSLSNTPITFGGRSIWPIPLRVMAMTWPLREGMGVYLVSNDGTSTVDLTPWMDWESGDATLTVGHLPRRLGYLPRPAS